MFKWRIAMAKYKGITGYEGQYVVTDMGEIVSFKDDKVRIMNAGTGQHGRARVPIGGKLRLVSRLVAEAFCEGYSDEKEVHHKNGEASDDRAVNLECLTGKEHDELHNQLGRRVTTGSTEQMCEFMYLYFRDNYSQKEIDRLVGKKGFAYNYSAANKIAKKYGKKCGKYNTQVKLSKDLVIKDRESMTTKQIADKYRVSKASVSYFVKKEGIASREYVRKLPSKETVREHRDSGMTIREIAEKYGASRDTVKEFCGRHGIYQNSSKHTKNKT
jgi:predicted DNA-binding protein YlxM (UPF0122 family)